VEKLTYGLAALSLAGLTWRDALEIISGLLVPVACYPYVQAIRRRETTPSKSSWIVWTVLSAMAAGAMWHAGELQWQISVVSICNFIVLYYALKHGTPEWKAVDVWCLIASFVGCALWVFTRNPVLAIAISMTVTIVGGIPTFVKTWERPESESARAWSVMLLSSTLASIGAPLTVAGVLQPYTYLAESAFMVFVTRLKPRLFPTV
jgi:hypothetical protein